jgi:uncharacterized protein YjbI with pentapeptide repeats
MKKIRTWHLTIGLVLVSAFALAQPKIDAREIIEKINRGEAVRYENVIIVGDLDFTDLKNKRLTNGSKGSSWFGGDTRTYTSTVSSPIDFRNCVFRDDVLAYYPIEGKNETHNAHFTENVHFEQCVFQGKSAFKYSEFSRKVSFARSKFTEEALFKYSKFSTGPDFSSARFDGEANFKYTTFPKGTTFSNSEFRRDADFKYAKFPDGVDMQNTTFTRFANFKYTSFSQPLQIRGIAFEGSEDFKYTKVDGRDFTSYLLKNR